jgi:sec-independent protein translocase protein TatA
MFGDVGVPEVIIILVILLLIFGPSRLGDLGASLGKGIRGFKRAIREPDGLDETTSKEESSRIESTRFEAQGKTVEKEEAKRV